MEQGTPSQPHFGGQSRKVAKKFMAMFRCKTATSSVSGAEHKGLITKIGSQVLHFQPLVWREKGEEWETSIVFVHIFDCLLVIHALEMQPNQEREHPASVHFTAMI